MHFQRLCSGMQLQERRRTRISRQLTHGCHESSQEVLEDRDGVVHRHGCAEPESMQPQHLSRGGGAIWRELPIDRRLQVDPVLVSEVLHAEVKPSLVCPSPSHLRFLSSIPKLGIHAVGLAWRSRPPSSL